MPCSCGLFRKRIRTWIYGILRWNKNILKNMDFVVKRLHISLCFHSYGNRDILHVTWIISFLPSIAATNDKKEIRIYVCDSKHDILLESREMNLFIEILGTKSQPLSYEAILAVWLVVNYRLLCNGPQSLLQVPKASFM